MTYARRVDANHADLKAAFEKLGCFVVDLSRVAGGVPDLAVSKLGKTVYVEVKTKDGERTPLQVKFFRECKGRVFQATTMDDAAAIVRAMLR